MKKIVSFVLVAAMLLSLTVPAAFAADPVSLSIDSSGVMEGATEVSSKLSLVSNPGELEYLSTVVFWSSDFDVDSVDIVVDTAVFDEENSGAGTIYSGSNKNVKNLLLPFGANTTAYKACVVDFYAPEGSYITGDILGSVVFTLAEPISADQSFEYSIAITDAGDFDYIEDAADVAVTVAKDPNLGRFTEPALFAVPVMMNNGKVRIDVRIDANPGIWAGYFALVYPDTWSVFDYSCGTVFDKSTLEAGLADLQVADNVGFLYDRLVSFPDTPTEGTRYISAYFQSEDDYEVNTNNGVLISYIFDVPEDAEAGDTADFIVIYDKEGDFIVNNEDDTQTYVTFDTASGAVVTGDSEHVLEDSAEYSAPTCTETGYRCGFCTDCGKSVLNILPLHYETLSTVTNEATCTENGKITVSCTACNEVVSETVLTALGHIYTPTVTEATCTDDGYTTYTCSRCQNVYTGDTEKALGHIITRTEIPATCTESGSYEEKCSRCNEVIVSGILEPLDHNYKVTRTAPTCTEAGYTTYLCLRCGDTYTGDTVTKLGHDFKTVTVAPTARNEGYDRHVCRRCRYSYNDNFTPAWDSFDTNVTATVSEEAGTVTVTLDLSGNSGLNTLVLSIAYNSEVLRVSSVENGEIFCAANGGTMLDPNTDAAPVTLYFDENSLGNISANGCLATVTFDVIGEGSYGIEIIPDDDSTFKAKGGLELETVYIGMTVKSASGTLCGDLNGDGKITAADAVIMKKIVVGKSAYASCADLNSDGKTTAADVVILKKMVVGKLAVMYI